MYFEHQQPLDLGVPEDQRGLLQQPETGATPSTNGKPATAYEMWKSPPFIMATVCIIAAFGVAGLGAMEYARPGTVVPQWWAYVIVPVWGAAAFINIGIVLGLSRISPRQFTQLETERSVPLYARMHFFQYVAFAVVFFVVFVFIGLGYLIHFQNYGNRLASTDFDLADQATYVLALSDWRSISLMTAAAWAIEFGFYVFVLYAESTPAFTADYIETAGGRSSQFTGHMYRRR